MSFRVYIYFQFTQQPHNIFCFPQEAYNRLSSVSDQQRINIPLWKAQLTSSSSQTGWEQTNPQEKLGVHPSHTGFYLIWYDSRHFWCKADAQHVVPAIQRDLMVQEWDVGKSGRSPMTAIPPVIPLTQILFYFFYSSSCYILPTSLHTQWQS